MKILTIVGARPQFIKAAVVSRSLSTYHPTTTEVLLHTGQHFDINMSGIFFEELKIPRPLHNLGIGGGSHGENTGRMLVGIEKVLILEKPDCVVVYGDTDSTLAGALTAAKLHIPVAHVEAGLRSFNRVMPEEINRVLTDHIATKLFTPTATATRNLKNEGIRSEYVYEVGDVMFDAADFYAECAETKSTILLDHGLKKKGYILATIHRAENTDDMFRLNEIFEGLSSAELPVVLPLHPRTKRRAHEFGLSFPKNFKILPPVGYLDMTMLEKYAYLVATDSGGVQKEAYFHRTPCITLRNETEWIETVQSGWNRLVSAEKRMIETAIKEIKIPQARNSKNHEALAGKRIADILQK